ncbi:MAG: glycoside hydrolase family 97 protein [Sphingomonas sp.]
MQERFWAVLAFLLPLPALAAEAQPVELLSPDGSIKVTVEASVGDTPPMYRIERKGETVIAPSPLGLDILYTKNFGPFDIAGTARRSVDEVHKLIATKASSARDHFNEVTISLTERVDGRRMDVVFRAYDDGIAFRYRVADQPLLHDVSLMNERTQFNFPTEYGCWGYNQGRMDLSHEGYYEPVRSSAIRWYNLYDVPFTCRTSSGRTAFLLAEADLQDYAGLYLRGRVDGGPGLSAQLSLRFDNRRLAVVRDLTKGDLKSSWRVVMLADRSGDLIPSNLIGNLNPQPTSDMSWVKAGKAAWDWWSDPHPAPPAGPGMSMESIKRFIDFAAESGFPYMLLDEGWSFRPVYDPNNLSNADILRTKPNLDMPALVRYARGKGVGILLWVQWDLLDKKMPEAFDLYASWGIKGVKIDFMDRNDQDMVAFYHRVMEEATKRRLLVDMHAAYPPTGLNRTYPNFLTQEGVMSAEYNKWGNAITSRHNVTIPFTRMVLGPIDYTPGAFINVKPQDFQFRWTAPMVQTTRAHQLAMFVVYESPLQSVADSPDLYRNAPGFDFIKAVPADWDETRFIAGDIGEYIVLARRKGRDWYVGAMTNETGRPIELPLSFLGDGQFTADTWQDGAEPSAVISNRRDKVSRGDVLSLKLAENGGATVRLTPAGGTASRTKQ